jgi:hypothetical protein
MVAVRMRMKRTRRRRRAGVRASCEIENVFECYVLPMHTYTFDEVNS